VTRAPGREASVGSRTTPYKVAVVTCAHTLAAEKRMMTVDPRMRRKGKTHLLKRAGSIQANCRQRINGSYQLIAGSVFVWYREQVLEAI
jgi:hypothetical protein